jgi:hypothetical protein
MQHTSIAGRGYCASQTLTGPVGKWSSPATAERKNMTQRNLREVPTLEQSGAYYSRYRTHPRLNLFGISISPSQRPQSIRLILYSPAHRLLLHPSDCPSRCGSCSTLQNAQVGAAHRSLPQSRLSRPRAATDLRDFWKLPFTRLLQLRAAFGDERERKRGNEKSAHGSKSRERR